MIPTDSAAVFSRGRLALTQFQAKHGAQGRFIAIYLGLRRMGPLIAPLGSSSSTSVLDIQLFLDELYAKTNIPGEIHVLTALFGSTAANGGFSARTNVVVPGRASGTNTWRNNFGIQKGIGCVAPPEEVRRLVAAPEGRMSCPYMQINDGKHHCTIAQADYRGEEHSIWLARTGGGYQVVDLNSPYAFRQYLMPRGQKIPLYALMAVIYSFAPESLLQGRRSITISDFAADFSFTYEVVQELFECDELNDGNALVLGHASRSAIIPTPPESPPGSALPDITEASALNTGVVGETAVAYLLMEEGWEVTYTGNIPGLGYDLHAIREGENMRVEVKSSIGYVTPVLTESEWGAACEMSESYVLAVVDHVGSPRQAVWFVRSPAEVTSPEPKQSVSYRLSRDQIETARTEVDFL